MLSMVGVEMHHQDQDHSHVEAELELRHVETAGSDRAVSVCGQIEAAFTVSCARCLGPARVRVQDGDLQLTFLPPGSCPEKGEELTQEDLDTYVHDGEQLDLEPVVREQLVLAIPMTPLCREDCRGICSSCGADLNQESCECKDAAHQASPWVEALAGLKADTSGI